nr:hypothetical protein [Corynebacterium fournieri]
MFTSRSRSLPLLAAAAAAALTLSACSDDSDADAGDTRAPEITSTETPPSDTDTATDTATEATTADESETAGETSRETAEESAGRTSTATTKKSATETTSSSTSSRKHEAQALDEVRELFATLAPPEFFDQFDDCSAGGLSGTYDCSGESIGQFQFFDSEAKAASTTQLLTELRSSRVVEDNGDRVVGWSTLGTSAIITVVDNRAGQVMQQLISSDQEDPRQRIYDLGLAKK